jgi:hypothetical protein
MRFSRLAALQSRDLVEPTQRKQGWLIAYSSLAGASASMLRKRCPHWVAYRDRVWCLPNFALQVSFLDNGDNVPDGDIKARREEVAHLLRYAVSFEPPVIQSLCHEFGCTPHAIKNDVRQLQAQKEVAEKLSQYWRPGANSTSRVTY